jgi:hypothetical protein
MEVCRSLGVPDLVYRVWRGSGEQLISVQLHWSVDDLVRVAAFLDLEALEIKIRTPRLKK